LIFKELDGLAMVECFSPFAPTEHITELSLSSVLQRKWPLHY